jgi:hypothetical protein
MSATGGECNEDGRPRGLAAACRRLDEACGRGGVSCVPISGQACINRPGRIGVAYTLEFPERRQTGAYLSRQAIRVLAARRNALSCAWRVGTARDGEWSAA